MTRQITFRQLGKRLRYIRDRLDITQKEVAQELGITQVSVAGVAKGEDGVASSTLFSLLLFYSKWVSIDHLLSDQFSEADEERIFNKHFEMHSVAREKLRMLREQVDRVLDDAIEMI